MMKKRLSVILFGLDFLLLAACYWIYLPALNIWSLAFWSFVIFGLILLLITLVILSAFDMTKTVTRSFKQGLGRKDVTGSFSKHSLTGSVKWLTLVIVTLVGILSLITVVNTKLFRAKSYAQVIEVKNADFNKDFPETDLSALALLDRDSAEKIGDTYLGTIDKVSQFGISEQVFQTIGAS